MNIKIIISVFIILKGQWQYLKLLIFFKPSKISSKTTVDCPPQYDQYGDPLPLVSVTVVGGGSGGSTSTGGTTGTTGTNSGSGGIGGGCTISYYSRYCWCQGNLVGTHNHTEPVGYIDIHCSPNVLKTSNSLTDCPDPIIFSGLVGGIYSLPPTKAEVLKTELNLTSNQWVWLRSKTEIADSMFDYLYLNDNSIEVKAFAVEMINTSMMLEINAVDVWNDYDNFRNQMSTSERDIFDNLLPNRKLWYMCAAKKAFDKANELFPNSVHNGKGDAFRHALWNGISSLLIGNDLTQQLTDAHENKPAPPGDPFNYKEIEMDLYNNNKGRQIAMISNTTNIITNVLNDISAGYLRYLNNLDSNSLATYNSILIPTNQ